MTQDATRPPRGSMAFDVVIVGAGPAGLCAAIRLKQLDPALSVVVLEKAAEVGAHILSGAVIDVSALDRLLPDWAQDPDHPLRTPVREDQFLAMGPNWSLRLPHALLPPLMSNRGSIIASLGDVCRWLARRAEALGVEIYPGFAATELLVDASGAIIGIATGDMGVRRDGVAGREFAPGMELHGKYVLIGEGARGSLAKQLIARFGLDQTSAPAKFGLGIKELWRVPAERHRPGLVQHGLGWPLDTRTGGGSFVYHFGDNLVAVGLVVHLDYANPHLSPFSEFQRFKTHNSVRPLLEGAERIGYGARALTEGGWQSVPRLSFPGGALIGCSAGFVNVPRIKGVHNAMASGVAAAEHAAAAIGAGRQQDTLTGYEEGWRQGPIGRDLFGVRNVKPLWSRFGTIAGVALGGMDMWLTTLFGRRSPFGTLRHSKADHESLRPAADYRPIDYPKPDGVVSFDRLSSVYLSNTNHTEDQPVHLHLKNAALQRRSELEVFGGPSARYCPAGVYEWVESTEGSRFVINAQNCVHCKTCDIKDPNQNIEWMPPQGGEGPLYSGM